MQKELEFEEKHGERMKQETRTLCFPALSHKDAEKETVKKVIRGTRFLPKMKKPAKFPLKWNNSGQAFISANEGYLDDRKRLVGCIEPLIDERTINSHTHRHVAEYLGLRGKRVSAKQLAGQLISIKEAIVENICPLESQLEYIHEVYKAMQLLCKDGNTEDTNLLRAAFHKHDLLYVNNCFESPTKYAFRCHGPCRPYLAEIPDQSAVIYRELFKTVGVKKQFDYSDYIAALKTMKTQFPYGQLPDTKIENAVEILQCICKSIEESKTRVTQALLEDIYVPDTTGVLQKSSKLCYNNCPWIKESGDMKFTHSQVAHSIAETLFMKTIRQDFLGKHSRKLGSKFGQREKLTTRIGRILKGYPRNSTIMKELLQNADDACATQVDFILDTRSHGTTQIFEESWKPLQGPALCVYNNRPFTEADLQGIQDLGEGSKGDSPFKTGQYGIGFNCVYHLTDTPMFITKGSEVGENLCVFDPHCKYVPGADEFSPGMKFTDFSDLKRQFPDIFSCFLEETGLFDLQNATLFRFPLRTKDMEANTNTNIAPHVTEDKVRELLDDFCKELPDCLIFLNHLKSVRIFEITTSGPKIIYAVNARISEGEESLQNFVSKTTRFKWLKQLQENEHIIYTLIVEDSRGLKKEYRVGQQIGYKMNEQVPHDVSLAYQRGDLLMLPRGGVAFLGKNHHHHTDKEMKGKLYCFLPLPLEVVLPSDVHVNGHFALASENRNELWKPSVQNEAMGYNKSWNQYLMKAVIAALYAIMLHDRTTSIDASVKANPKAYKAELDKYFSLFPSSSKKQEDLYTDHLYDNIYRYLHKQCLPVLPIARPNSLSLEWHSTGSKQQLYFDCLHNCDILKESTKQKLKEGTETAKAQQLLPAFKVVQMLLLQSGMNLLSHVPLKIHDSMKTVLAKEDRNAVTKIKPKDVWNFFRRHPMKEKLPRQVSNSKLKTLDNVRWLLRYCNTDTKFLENLDGLPFLVTKDNMLRIIEERRPVFLSEYSDLVANQNEKFVHPDLGADIKKLKSKNAVFKPLKISSLASLLATSNIPKNEDTILTNNEAIDRGWLCRLWAFLGNETKRVFEQHSKGAESIRKAMDATDNILKPIDNWSIFPVRRGNNKLLIPLKHTKSVIDFEQGQMPDSLKTVLLQMQLPVPDYNFVLDKPGTPPTRLLKSLVTSIDKPHSVLACVGQHIRKHDTTVLPEDNARAFLNYVAGNLDTIKKVPDARDTLKRLPYYTTVSKRQVKLEGAQAYLIPVSSRMPIDDLDKCEDINPPVLCIPASTEPELNALFTYLGVQQGQEAHLYANFILQSEIFCNMSQPGRVAHLAYIKDEVLSKAPERGKGLTKSSLIERLRGLEFIQDKSGILHKACEFYDSNNKVFKVLHPDGPFLPDDFNDPKWSSFLRELGLVSEISEETFVQYAEQIQTSESSIVENDPSSRDTFQQSQALLDHFYQRQKHSDNFLDQIKGIRFIIPYDCGTLRSLHPQCMESPSHKLSFAKFEGSIQGSKETALLCWTNVVIIPYSQTNLTMKQMERLGLITSISLDKVVSHLGILCEYISSDDCITKMQKGIEKNQLIEVFISIYNHFKLYLDDIESYKSQLEQMKFVLVGNGMHLVKPTQLVTHMMPEDELPPYLYRVPDEFLTFKNIFKKLGTADQVTSKHYGDILLHLYNICTKSKLNPNELIAALKAYVKLVESAQSKPDRKVPEYPMKQIESLYLPYLKDGHISLGLSTELVFIDNVLLHERLRGLKENLIIDASMYLKSSEHPETSLSEILQNKLTTDKLKRFFEALPDSKKPIYLSRCFREEIDGNSEDKNLIHNEFARSLSARIQSQEFQDGFLRLYKDATASGKEDSFASKIEEQEKRTILEEISKIEIIGLKEVKTYIKFRGKRVEGSEKAKPMFYKKLRDSSGKLTKYKLYIPGDSIGNSVVLLKVGQFLDRVTGSKLGSNSIHLLQLLTKHLSSISQYLDEADVAPLERSAKDSFSFSLPVLGDFIPTADHHLLNQSFEDFREGEYIGKDYSICDPEG